MFDQRADELWARGASYKVGFDARGTTFVPFLGASAPRNFDVVFGAPSVLAGGVDLALRAVALPVLADDCVRIDRGLVDEVDRLSLDAIEQQFVVELPVDGEIVVSIPVTTELEPCEIEGELRFTNELGHVSYGGATAIDADGRRLALTRNWIDGHIEIRVPEAFARTASYPLTIDPVVSAFGIFAGSDTEELHSDIAYDMTTQRYLVVVEEAFSAIDHDIFSRLLDINGAALVGTDLLVDGTVGNWSRARCANAGYGSAFAVVAEFGPASGPRSILARVRDLIAFGSVIVLADTSDGDHSLPDVAGCDQLTLFTFSAVWQRHSPGGDVDISGIVFFPNGALATAILPISADPLFNDELPAISSGSFSGEYAVVFQRATVPTDHDILLSTWMNTGSSTLAPTVIQGGASDDTHPAISDRSSSGTGGVHALVAFQRQMGGQHDIFVGELNPSDVFENVSNISALDPASASVDQFTPVVECDQNRFVLAWCEAAAGGDDLYAAEIHGSGLAPVVAIPRVPVDVGSGTVVDVRIGARTLENPANVGLIFSWTEDAPGVITDIFGARYVPTTGIPVRAVCLGDGSGTACPCGNTGAIGRGCANSLNPAGALLSSTGDAALLAETFVLSGLGMPPGVACLYFQGVSSSPSVFGDGLRCATGTVIRLGTKFNSATGTSAYPTGGDTVISVRGSIGVQGGRRYYQAWYRNAAAFCTSNTFNLSNALEVYWTKL